ncbi:MAG: AmmeMemoRadiSam system protein B [Patescibacteria group bacterium]|nr:AmmeMemoRadiSam system protein B [Patescibacteria group bacterium]
MIVGNFSFENFQIDTSYKGNLNKDIDKSEKKLSSYFKNKKDYDSAFLNVFEINKKEIKAGITSHHFLAKNLIANFFSGIDGNEIRNIILIGPDHYGELDKSKIDIVTTKLSWDTPFGQMDSNLEIQDKLLTFDYIKENDSVFRNEHSIYTLVPFIKKSFPKVRIVPLIIKNNKDYKKYIDVGNDIKMVVGEGALIIISSDFSHNVSIINSQENDLKSIESLKGLNEENIDNVNSDCRACLAILLGYLEDEEFDFYLKDNKNSSDFGSQDKTVTSYVSGYYIKSNITTFLLLFKNFI